ncbi:hypothetical protein HNQ08_004339 [Deinococcus humi]|uniref:Uncharacterized protein n=1 Tax=Deinococcus humi TaxID=662880 RepID=A0A7W8NHW7_9DEIO|nr:hypothetical protein [Deinococcus humi]GGO35648.1 hypothetical protein GCM10008949_38440 [Deinococcus humi]
MPADGSKSISADDLSRLLTQAQHVYDETRDLCNAEGTGPQLENEYTYPELMAPWKDPLARTFCAAECLGS